MMSFIERDPQDERSKMFRLLVVKDKAFARIFLFNKKDGAMDFFCKIFPEPWANYIYFGRLKGFLEEGHFQVSGCDWARLLTSGAKASWALA